MSNPLKHGKYWRFQLAAAVIIIAVIIFGLAAFFHTSGSKPGVTIVIDTNGVPLIAGVPLLNTNLRNGTFKAMSAMGVKVSTLRLPPVSSADPNVSKVIDTLESVRRAGLLNSPNSNRPPNPSPYE